MELESTTKIRQIKCEYQNYIETPPVTGDKLYKQSCSNDVATINHWLDKWIDNVRMNKKKFGSFKEKHIGQLWGNYSLKPCIIAGAGPSLKENVKYLKMKQDIPLISCLHNFHLMVENDINVDWYVTLDAGDVTAEEVYEGGDKPQEWYWEQTKGKKLLAFIGASPLLLEKWQGEVYFFNCPVPDDKYHEEVDKIEKFAPSVGTGGNVLGACLYIAKAFLGANPIAFVGADFAFGYDNKFHGWDSKYDKEMGNVIKAVDVFGNKVLTWPSYYNFKCWFDWVSMSVPGLYINCTDGGTFGAYNEGNLMSVKQMPISHFINMYYMHEHMKKQSVEPESDEKKLLF